MEEASVLCLPCVIDRYGNRDSQPVVIKEAMALELPVIGTDEVAIPEMVDESTGILVPPGDPERLADGLVEMARMGPEQRRAMGRRGRLRVEELFTIEGGTRALLEAWEDAEPGAFRRQGS
jgi:glycosyltransferase involved in cell wall biosynthesis